MIEINVTVIQDKPLDSKQIDQATKEALIVTRELIETSARTDHRYNSKTGRLTRATKVKTVDQTLKAYIDDNTAKYGKYIHSGFKGWAPDRFLERAIESNLNKIDDIMISKIDKALI